MWEPQIQSYIKSKFGFMLSQSVQIIKPRWERSFSMQWKFLIFFPTGNKLSSIMEDIHTSMIYATYLSRTWGTDCQSFTEPKQGKITIYIYRFIITLMGHLE